MDIELELQEMSVEYGISLPRIQKYYDMISRMPFVKDYGEDLLLECVENIVQDMTTNDFKSEEARKVGKVNERKPKNLNYSISDSLFRTYGEVALPYLDPEYVEHNEDRYSL